MVSRRYDELYFGVTVWDTWYLPLPQWNHDDDDHKLTGMGSRQFCRGREVEAEARQVSNVLNRGEAESSRPRRGRLN